MSHYTPNRSELNEMSIASLESHVQDLLGKYAELSPEQRRELRAIGMAILTNEKREAA